MVVNKAQARAEIAAFWNFVDGLEPDGRREVMRALTAWLDAINNWMRAVNDWFGLYNEYLEWKLERAN